MGRSGEKREESIAVAVDKDKNSQYALKWTVENLLPRGQSVSLVHVNLKPSSVSGIGSLPNANSDSREKDVFLSFRCFCTRRDVAFDEIVLEDTDISSALIEYVRENVIDTLVLGAPSRSNILRRFKTADVPSSVTKGAPAFCNVYVIAKGRVSSMRSSSGAPPLKPQSRHNQLETEFSSLSARSEYRICRDAEREEHSPGMLQEEISIKSPFERKGYAGRYQPSISETDISHVSSGKLGTDRMFAIFNDSEPGLAPRLSSSSEFDDRSSFTSYSSGKRSLDFGPLRSTEFSSSSLEGTSTPWSTHGAGDLEAEMWRLKLELKQTMEMYNNACRVALNAKQKAGELHQLEFEREKNIEEARLAQETALALAEREKAKHKAGLAAAATAQKIAECEAQKREQAENKSLKDAEEKQRALEVPSHRDLRYRRYTIMEIEEATDNFSNSRKIGEGGYGPVYKGILEHTPVAIKVLRSDETQGRSQFHQEVEVLTCMRHPNMVLLLGACPEHGCLVYEYMANGSLEDRLFRRGNCPALPWQLRFRIAAEIATGLHFLHQTKPEPLVHRDLKPANILLDRNFVSKISDVGLARLVPAVADAVTQYRMTATAGTFCYIDPEYQQTGMVGVKSDVYSLGIMLLQIITAKPPMGLTHHVEGAVERGTFAEVLDPAVKDWPVEDAMRLATLALKCAELRRKDRPDLGKVILPELERLRAHAEESMPAISFGDAWANRSSHSQFSSSSQVSSDALLRTRKDFLAQQEKFAL